MRHVVCVVALVLAFLGVGLLAGGQPAAAPAAKVRVGTYDSRAIAVAYAASAHNPVGAKMAELQKAKADNDKKKIAELEAWGKDHQRTLHFQGFSRVPVDDLLAPVKDQIARLAADQGLAVIADDCTFTAANVEMVDVTDQLVELYKPNDRTKNSVKMIHGQKPVPLTTIADMPAEQ